MATLTDGQMRPSFDQKWDLQVLQGRYGRASIGKTVLNKSSIVSDSGEVVNITVKPRITAGTVGSDGGFTAMSLAFTNVQVNVNTWQYVSHIITDKQKQQSILTLTDELPKQYGEALQEQSEMALADLFLGFTGFNGSVGQGIGAPGAGINFGRDSALLAVQATRRRQLPTDKLVWHLPVEGFTQGWLKEEQQTTAQNTGLDKSLIMTGIYGFKQMILGFPAYESTLLNGASTVNIDTGAAVHAASGINLPGTTVGALLHEEALAYAFQINAKYKQADMLPAQVFGTICAAGSLYGVTASRANHGVPMYISNGN